MAKDFDKLTRDDVVRLRSVVENIRNQSVASNEPSVNIREVFNEKKEPMRKNRNGKWVVDTEAMKPEPELFDKYGNKLVMSADRKTLVPVRADAGKEMRDIGGVNTKEVLKTLLNKADNIVRPEARKQAWATPTGLVGNTLVDITEDIKGKQIADNPLARLFSDTMKSVSKKGAEAVGMNPVIEEERILESLKSIVPAMPYPEKAGVKKYSGIGTFKTPYGTFSIDESGTLRKV